MAPEGRQSPEPKDQPGKQLQEPVAQDPNFGQAESDKEPQDKSKKFLQGLESNPEHILAQSAEDKTSKNK
jgi:hypothetical protein